MIGDFSNGEEVSINGAMFDHYDDVLDLKFGLEYDSLLMVWKMILITDFASSHREDQRCYERNIGAGNLASYVRTLIAQINRKKDDVVTHRG